MATAAANRIDELTKYILTRYQDTRNGLPIEKALTFEAVTFVEQLRDSQRHGSGKNLEKIEVATSEGPTTWYVLTLWYAGGDDADDWCHLFETKEAAISAYDDFA